MKKQKLVDDFVTVAGGILKSIQGAKDLSKNKFRDKITSILEELDFAHRLEVRELREMIIKSKEDIEILKKKLSNLEKKQKTK